MDSKAYGIILLWVAVYTVAVSIHVCDFESDDACGYVQDINDDFDWTVRQGDTPTSDTGPSFDHTLGANSTGHYMYIEASGPGVWDIARLISPTFRPSPAFCVRFFYHMNGEDTGRLSVRLRSGGEVADDALWTLKGEQGGDWIEAEVDGSSSTDFEITFEAKRGEGFKSDIAIDDVTVTSGTTCSGTIITPPPSSKPATSNEHTLSPKSSESTRTVRKTSSSSTVTRQPANNDALLEPIDSHLVIVVLAVGLSFWGVVFSVLAIVIYKSGQSLRRKKDNATYDVIDDSANQEVIVMTRDGSNDKELVENNTRTA